MDHIPLRGAIWRKSSYSGTQGGNCVEVAANLPGVVAVQDSKNPGPALTFSPAAWDLFTRGVRAGQLARQTPDR